MEKNGHGTGHIAYFDWIRAAGCVAVVLIHLCAVYSSAASVDDMGFANAVRNMFVPTILARWAVPLFFMVSGALLLDPARSVGMRKIAGYIGRMLAVLATFGLAFSLMKCVADAGTINADVVVAAVAGVLDESTWGHLWYIGALIGLYLATPFIRAFTRDAGVRHIEIALVVLYVLGCVIPLLNATTGFSLTTFIPVPYTLFYYLLGYYAHALIEQGLLARVRGGVMVPVALAGAAGLVGMLVAIVVNILWMHSDGYIFTDPLSCLVGPYALLVFMLFKRYANRPVRPTSLIGVLSTHCFGIYIVHPVFTRLIKMIGLTFSYMAMPPLVGEAVFTAAILALTIPCVWLLNRTHFCRDYLRL